MHTMNKNSWHYKLATTGKDPWELEYFDEECDNFCKYARSVFNGILRYSFMGLILTFIFGAAVYAVGDTLAWLGWMLFNLSLVEPGVGATFMIMLTILFGGYFLFDLIKKALIKLAYSTHKTSHKIHVALEKKDSGFIHLLYKKYKEKVCFRIEYK